MVFADELESHLVPKIGAAGRPQGTQPAVMTPGTDAKHSLAGALELSTGILRHGGGPRKTKALCRELLQTLDATDPAPQFERVDVVVENKIHKAKAVAQWRAQHSRFTRLCLPTSGPRANPIERAVGEVHDLGPRNHTRKRWRDLGADVEEHRHVNGPWKSKLSELYSEPAVTAAVEKMVAEQGSPAAA
jgi:hypothetical protein